MVGKTYYKTISRLYRKNILRFVIMVSLIALSVAIVTGIGAIAPRMYDGIELIKDSRTEQQIAFSTSIADKIQIISYIFPVFFIIVAVMVVFITVTRLVEEERAGIAVLKTMGYNNTSIIFKYVLFAASAAVIGCTIGIILGYFGILPVLFKIIADEHKLPTTNYTFPTFGFVSAVLTILLISVVAFFITFLSCREKPSKLLTYKSPKAGGKILLERMPFIWKRLKFKYKSTIRNIVRYKMRFAMTVFSVMGATALVFVGIALFFVLKDEEMAGSIVPISVVLTVSSVLLAALIIYNITNINIEERKREIATLRVLGYKNIEVCGYIFRELFFLVIIGIALGLPLGFAFLKFLMDSMNFGAVDNIKWYVWIIATALSLVALALANLLLFRKIHRVDMNGSLKTID